ncbi:MAG: type III pantothenate kinase [Actinomycetota bacterium]
MLLAVDVGNTSSVIGLFDGEDLAAEWRIATRYRTTDELEVVLRGLLAARQIRPDAITSGCLSTTVPPVQGAWEEVLQRVAGTAPVVIEPGVRTGVAVRVQNPREVGPDRIANAAAAAALHGAPAIVVDFGTATNFDVVAADGAFVGGAIAPGLEVSMEALFARAARLGKVELVAPPSAIGTATVDSLQSGAVYGFAGLVDGLVGRLRAELDAPDCPVVATGGLAVLLAEHCATVTAVDPQLTLVGLRLIHERAGAA